MDRNHDLLYRCRCLSDADRTVAETASDLRGGAKVLKQVINWQKGRRYIDSKTINGAPFTGTRFHVWEFPGQECVVLTEVDSVFKDWKIIPGGLNEVVDKCIEDSVS